MVEAPETTGEGALTGEDAAEPEATAVAMAEMKAPIIAKTASFCSVSCPDCSTIH